jgi:hypothetical protein
MLIYLSKFMLFNKHLKLYNSAILYKNKSNTKYISFYYKHIRTS